MKMSTSTTSNQVTTTPVLPYNVVSFNSTGSTKPECKYKSKKCSNDSIYKKNGIIKARPADPLKDENLIYINKIKNYFLENGKYRDYVIFVMGLNTGRRAGDVVKLTVGDVYDFKNGCFKDKVELIEQKTKKRFNFCFLNSSVKDALQIYFSKSNVDINELKFDDLLFKSRKNGYHVEPRSYYYILNKAAEAVGVPSDVNIGTHTMRKSFGANWYASGCSITEIKKALNHTNEEVTARYIGIDEEHMRKIFNSNAL